MSPYSAFAMGTLVEHDWDGVKGNIAAWREKVRDHPALLRALGKKYWELKQYDEAEKCLARYVEQSPDRTEHAGCSRRAPMTTITCSTIPSPVHARACRRQR